MRVKKKKTKREAALDALKAESERDLTEQIHRLLAKPMNERTNFLRVRLPVFINGKPGPGGSAL